MSCKEGKCGLVGHEDDVFCCALCPDKKSCTAFCNQLNGPDDTYYVTCEEFIPQDENKGGETICR